MHRHRRPVSSVARTMPLAAAILCTLGLQSFAQSSPAPAGAAPASKRLCKPRIEWTGVGATRAEAQRKAVDGWSTAAVTAHGEDFSKWAIAGIARVGCSLTSDGHRCRAAASPCRDLTDGPGSTKR